MSSISLLLSLLFIKYLFIKYKLFLLLPTQKITTNDASITTTNYEKLKINFKVEEKGTVFYYPQQLHNFSL